MSNDAITTALKWDGTMHGACLIGSAFPGLRTPILHNLNNEERIVAGDGREAGWVVVDDTGGHVSVKNGDWIIRGRDGRFSVQHVLGEERS